jgi:dTMP kinase
MQLGQLVTFEGIDGCGKSTQVRLFSEKMRDTGRRVVVFREPGGTPVGEGLRKLLKNGQNTPEAELFMLGASRAQLAREVIAPALESGFLVVGDRFLDSTYAYQQYGMGIDPHLVQSVVAGATGGIVPSISFFIDVPVDIAISRTRERGGAGDSFERRGAAFFEKVREGYLRRCANSEALVRVDGLGEEKEILQRVMNVWNGLVEGRQRGLASQVYPAKMSPADGVGKRGGAGVV